MRYTTFVCLVLLLHALSAVTEAADNKNASFSAQSSEITRYARTNSERRQEGGQHKITPWLTASTMVDLEWRGEELSIRSGGSDSIREHSANFQLGLTVTPWEFLQGEFGFEYDVSLGRWETDEAFIEFEVEEWEFQVGRLYTPFGEYISHFPSGPLLEFGETRVDGINLSYDPGQLFEISLNAYRGEAYEVGSHSSRIDWVAALSANIDDRYLFGLSYQSDLADANSKLLVDQGDRYERKVAAASGYFIWSTKEFELSFELLGALDSFRELDHDRNRPFAWNLGFVHFVNSDWEWALRVEGSRELEGEPEWQAGAALTWHINQNVSCSVEYLHGHFKHGLHANQEDEPYEYVDRIGAQISVGF